MESVFSNSTEAAGKRATPIKGVVLLPYFGVNKWGQVKLLSWKTVGFGICLLQFSLLWSHGQVFRVYGSPHYSHCCETKTPRQGGKEAHPPDGFPGCSSGSEAVADCCLHVLAVLHPASNAVSSERRVSPPWAEGLTSLEFITCNWSKIKVDSVYAKMHNRWCDSVLINRHITPCYEFHTAFPQYFWEHSLQEYYCPA